MDAEINVGADAEVDVEVPPAGGPTVELGLLSDKQLVISLIPKETTLCHIPAVPLPRKSPPINTNVVSPRKDGVQVNPVPRDTTVVIVSCGMENDCPPGITPKKLGVLEIAKIRALIPI